MKEHTFLRDINSNIVHIQIVWYPHFVAIFLEFLLLFDPSRANDLLFVLPFLCSVMWTGLNALWLPLFHIPSSIRIFLPSFFVSSTTYVCIIFYNFVLLLFWAQSSNEKSNISFIAWSTCFFIRTTTIIVIIIIAQLCNVHVMSTQGRTKSLLWNVQMG